MNTLELKNMIEEYRQLGIEAELVRDKLVKFSKVDPYNDDNFVKLCICYLSQGDNVEALKYIKRAILLESGNENYWFLQGVIYEDLKSYQHALEAYYYAYRLGSEVSQKKLFRFCENSKLLKLSPKIKEKLLQFKETIC